MRFLTVFILLVGLTPEIMASPDAVNKAAENSTVLVMSRNSDGTGAYGSAAYVGHGLFITNHHVVDGFSQFTVTKPSTIITHKVSVIYSNKAADVAILFTLDENILLDPVVFADANPRGRCWAAGYGMSLHDDVPGMYLRVYGGGVARYDVGNKHWYRFAGKEGASIQGDSGGPAFNKNGEYVGAVWGTDRTNTYAVKLSTIQAIAEELTR